jgi:hypothetical protein
MEDYPRSLSEFEACFATEQACRDYLFRLRWPQGFCCPRCGCRKSWPLRVVLRQCADCGYQISVTAGTIFQDTRTSLKVWFQAMWWVTTQKNGASALGLQRVLGLKQYQTAWTWLHKLRRAMVRPGRDLLAGRVEVDESYLGGPEEGLRGRQAGKKALIVSADIKHPQNCRFCRWDRRWARARDTRMRRRGTLANVGASGNCAMTDRRAG